MATRKSRTKAPHDLLKDMLHDVLVGLVRDDGSMHVLGRVGGGFSDEDRRAMLADLRELACESEYSEVNSDHVAYRMVRPEWVFELACLDLVAVTTRGQPIERMVLSWDRDASTWRVARRLPLASLITFTFAVAVSIPVLRVRGPYFVILTFGLAEFVKYVVMAVEAHLGQFGRLLLGVPSLTTLYWLTLFLAALAVLITFTVHRSRLGQGLIAIREDEEAAAISAAHAGVMPLPDDIFTRGKCGLKALLYMACGQVANLMLSGFQSPAVKLLGVAQISLIVTAIRFDSPRVQLGVIAVLYVLTGWYALNFIPEL